MTSQYTNWQVPFDVKVCNFSLPKIMTFALVHTIIVALFPGIGMAEKKMQIVKHSFSIFYYIVDLLLYSLIVYAHYLHAVLIIF